MLLTEISSEYVDESMSYLLWLPMHSGTVLCCCVKSDNTVYLDFWREDCLKTAIRQLLNGPLLTQTVENCNFKSCY